MNTHKYYSAILERFAAMAGQYPDVHSKLKVKYPTSEGQGSLYIRARCLEDFEIELSGLELTSLIVRSDPLNVPDALLRLGAPGAIVKKLDSLKRKRK